jgi:hypothetical protein
MMETCLEQVLKCGSNFLHAKCRKQKKCKLTKSIPGFFYYFSLQICRFVLTFCLLVANEFEISEEGNSYV